MLKPILEFLAFPLAPILVLGGLFALFLVIGYAVARDLYRLATVGIPPERERFASYIREHAEREKGVGQ